MVVIIMRKRIFVDGTIVFLGVWMIDKILVFGIIKSVVFVNLMSEVVWRNLCNKFNI